ncbi:MAG: hypothetical protein ABI459_06880, partial [Deltaproteobacteria bacterium]
MGSASISDIREVLLSGTGRTSETLDREHDFELTSLIFAMVSRPKVEAPSKTELEIDAILKLTKDLSRRIEALDKDVRTWARNHHDEDEKATIFGRLEVAISADDMAAHAAAVSDLTEIHERPLASWIDFAALSHVKELERCLTLTQIRVIELAPKGAGRPKNRKAHNVALAAARAYVLLTGEQPTFWNQGQTP